MNYTRACAIPVGERLPNKMVIILLFMQSGPNKGIKYIKERNIQNNRKTNYV